MARGPGAVPCPRTHCDEDMATLQRFLNPDVTTLDVTDLVKQHKNPDVEYLSFKCWLHFWDQGEQKILWLLWYYLTWSSNVAPDPPKPWGPVVPARSPQALQRLYFCWNGEQWYPFHHSDHMFVNRTGAVVKARKLKEAYRLAWHVDHWEATDVTPLMMPAVNLDNILFAGQGVIGSPNAPNTETQTVPPRTDYAAAVQRLNPQVGQARNPQTLADCHAAQLNFLIPLSERLEQQLRELTLTGEGRRVCYEGIIRLREKIHLLRAVQRLLVMASEGGEDVAHQHE